MVDYSDPQKLYGNNNETNQKNEKPWRKKERHEPTLMVALMGDAREGLEGTCWHPQMLVKLF
jgi:hypothetical protein